MSDYSDSGLANVRPVCYASSMNKREAKVKQVQELRRSNAAQPHKNKARYSRKAKHRKNQYV